MGCCGESVERFRVTPSGDDSVFHGDGDHAPMQIRDYIWPTTFTAVHPTPP